MATLRLDSTTARAHLEPRQERRLLRRHRRLTPREVDQLVEDYQGGMSIKEICLRLGTHKSTVFLQLERRGVTMRRQNLTLTADQVQTAIDLYAHGLGLNRIATALETSHVVVRRELVANGLKIRRRGEKSPKP